MISSHSYKSVLIQRGGSDTVNNIKRSSGVRTDESGAPIGIRLVAAAAAAPTRPMNCYVGAGGSGRERCQVPMGVRRCSPLAINDSENILFGCKLRMVLRSSHIKFLE